MKNTRRDEVVASPRRNIPDGRDDRLARRVIRCKRDHLAEFAKPVNHSAKEYARGIVHTNSIESAFGLFKRAVVGSFRQVSAKHLDRYLDEFEYRFSNRKNPYLFRDVLVRLMEGKALPYEQLTA